MEFAETGMHRMARDRQGAMKQPSQESKHGGNPNVHPVVLLMRPMRSILHVASGASLTEFGQMLAVESRL
jgi:hypothetical protein